MPTESHKIFEPKFIFLFILAAYVSYLFHEFGHWIVGEILGNRMHFSLNLVWPVSGNYKDPGHNLFVSIGGPAFSILQSLLALLAIEKFKNLHIYPFAFFPMFSRFFSLAFGGYDKQDEARISMILNAGKYTVAIIVVFILILIIIRSSYRLKISLKENNYFIFISTLCQLLVIGSYKLFS